jgi:hypothetical protein
MSFSINYSKNFNKNIRKHLESNNELNVSKVQNYYPIYDKYFNLNEKNYNSINLNHKYQINTIDDNIDYNNYKATLIDNCSNIIEKNIFLKFSPLIDSTKYLVGQYENIENIFDLPKKNNKRYFPKYLNSNNLSYVDCFFTYLTSKLLNENKFVHGLDFYGTFLCIKNDFNVDVCDEIELLEDSDYFNKNLETLFNISENYYEYSSNNSRNYKKNIKIGKSLSNLVFDDLEVIDTTNNNDISSDKNGSNTLDSLIFDSTIKSNSKSNNKSNHTNNSSYCSSRSSDTEDEEDEDDAEGDSECDSEGDDEHDSDDDEHEEDENEEEEEDEEVKIIATIKKFPVQIIALEKCNNTLDYLLSNELINSEELGAILMQIIFTLISYQKMFNFTHNDLHTNNIMYVETDTMYLYYYYNNKYYKVPTYGKIFKIIDFGRAIYSYKKELMCSDSFSLTDGDASTQYNFGPYYDETKPIIEPNYSFDLCRLACSIFDFIIDDMSVINDVEDEVYKIIIDWCKDDKNRNVLYKNNGEERYLEFKLYKMIARTVHNHLPHNQLEREYFNKFKVSKKKLKPLNFKKLINIDEFPIHC